MIFLAEKHSNWKGGISVSYYQRISDYSKPCGICGTLEKKREVHHIDGNRKNNQLDNLMILCRSCNIKEIKKNKWSREHGQCIECNTIEIEHTKEGLCRKCYYFLNKGNLLKQKKEYYIKNKDIISIYKKKYHIENKEKILEKNKEYYIKNKNKILERRKEYYFKNKKRILERDKEYCLRNKDKISKRKRILYLKKIGRNGEGKRID